jgi:hypothetical protein
MNCRDWQCLAALLILRKRNTFLLLHLQDLELSGSKEPSSWIEGKPALVALRPNQEQVVPGFGLMQLEAKRRKGKRGIAKKYVRSA